jgi:hypothetical protein
VEEINGVRKERKNEQKTTMKLGSIVEGIGNDNGTLFVPLEAKVFASIVRSAFGFQPQNGFTKSWPV